MIIPSESFIGKTLTVTIDRPLGSKHPDYGFEYPVNYGYIEGVMSHDGEELDAYVLGVSETVEQYTGICVGVIKRMEENDDKLIIVPEGKIITKNEIIKSTHFQEKWFTIEVVLFA